MSEIRPAIALLTACALAACGAEKPLETRRMEALRLHRAAIVIDGHSDTTPRFRDPDWRFGERQKSGHMDLPRIREGGLDAQFWSIYLGRRQGDGLAIREALELIDGVHEMIGRHGDRVALARSAAEIRRVVGEGKLASLMGLEGGHIIEGNLSALRSFYRLGVRYMTLTHSFHTGWADSSGIREVPPPLHHGLTQFGKEVVREMNRLGMIVDVSHVSDETFWDVLRASRAPLIASHSSCRAIADHPRNLSDDMLGALAANGGVVMINFYPGYIDAETQRRTVEHRRRLKPALDAISEKFRDDPSGRRRAYRELGERQPWPSTSLAVLLDHFDHALRVAGPDHVGLGADWDGVASMPEGMEDVSKLPALTFGLLERGHASDTVVKVLGGNLLRVLAKVERVAAELRHGKRP